MFIVLCFNLFKFLLVDEFTFQKLFLLDCIVNMEGGIIFIPNQEAHNVLLNGSKLCKTLIKL